MTVEPLLRLYPGPWRRRYGSELAALLADAPPGWRDRADLVRGALDAHLHPMAPPAWPVYAAAIGGIAWTFAAATALGQPVPPDWPFHLLETLPVHAAAVPLLALAAIGTSTRLGDRSPAAARWGRVIVVVAAAAWATLLAAAAAGLVGGVPTVVAATVMAVGTLLIGVALLAAGDAVPACPLLAASVLGVLPLPWAPVAFGAAWAVAAVVLVRDPRPIHPLPAPDREDARP